MTDDVARRLAGEIDRRGLAGPARLLLDAHRPIAPLVADLGAALGPLARLGGRAGRDAASLLDDERAMERLIEALDATGDRRAGPG